jgi:hypothetical protein
MKDKVDGNRHHAGWRRHNVTLALLSHTMAAVTMTPDEVVEGKRYTWKIV